MKKFAVIPNLKKDTELEITHKVVSFISKKAQVFMDEAVCNENFENVIFVQYDELFKLADIIVSLGGDGTILGLSECAARENKPVLGVNLGNLGFLAEVEINALEKNFSDVLSGNFEISRRMMLSATILRNGKVINEFSALNDIVVTRSSFSRMVNIKVCIDDKLVNFYNSDGVVVATPTGSTAYSLSAGGPIVEPTLSVMLLTPICPHSLHSRTIIIPDDKELTLHIENYNDSEAMLTADGREGQKLLDADTIKIKKSAFETHLIKVNGKSFYEVLRYKLSERDG